MSQNRQKLNLSEVATGEYWFGYDALKMNLIDELKTSDEYLFSKRHKAEIYEISIDESEKKSFLKKIMESKLLKPFDFYEKGLDGGFNDLKTSKAVPKTHNPSNPYEDLMLFRG